MTPTFSIVSFNKCNINILLSFTFLLFQTSFSQQNTGGFYVTESSNVSIKPSSFIYVNGDVIVDYSSNITAESDEINSSSLIVKGNSFGDITYKRYLKGSDNASSSSEDWHLVSVPVGTQNIKNFAKEPTNEVSRNGNEYAIGFYEDKWEYYTTSSTEDFITGKGYSTHRNSNGFYTFNGEVPDTDVHITLTLDNNSSLWSSLGNPYPSFLPFNSSNKSVLKDNENILDPNYVGLYIWNRVTGEYEVVNYTQSQDSGGSLPDIPGGNFNDAQELGHDIIPGQAFMVKFNTNNPTFIFSKNLQKPQSKAAVSFSRSKPLQTITVKLNNGDKIAKTKLKFLSNASKGLDVGYDAGTFINNNTQNFSINTHLVSDSNGVDFTLQCLPDSDYENYKIPLSVFANENETISFSSEATNLPEGINVYLEDTLKNTLKNITDESYTVTLESKTESVGRFYLQTSSSSLSIKDNNNLAEIINVYKKDNNTIRITGFNNLENAQLKIYSLNGKEVFVKHFSTQRLNDVSIPNLAKGVYIVQLISSNKNYTKKIVIE